MANRDDTLRGQAVAFVGIAIVASAFSLAAFHYQLRALSIGGRDLGFFMAEYDRLLEMPPWRELAVQPNGNNAFGFTGLDGHPTLHHDIHLSPLKYALAMVFSATESWLAVQLVLVLTVLAALGYALVRWHRVAPGNALALSAIASLVLSPPFVRASCHDLRPAVALGAFAVAFAVACLSRAPRSHLWVIAVLGLLVREDAAVILALGCAWLSLDGRQSEARPLYALTLGYVVVFHALYFGVLSFRYAPHAQTVAVWVALLLAPVLAAIPAGAHAALSVVHARHRAWTILVLALPFVVVWLEPVFGGHLVRSALARSFPAFLLAGIAATYWLLADGPARVRHVATVLALVAVLPSVASSVWMIADLRSMADRREPVWALAAQLPSDTPILTDFANYQAFAGRDRLLVWERLPAAVEPTEAREFPASRLGLVALLVDLDGLLIVSDSSYGQLTDTLRSAGIEPSFEVCSEGATFVVARPLTGHTPCPRL